MSFLPFHGRRLCILPDGQSSLSLGIARSLAKYVARYVLAASLITNCLYYTVEKHSLFCAARTSVDVWTFSRALDSVGKLSSVSSEIKLKNKHLCTYRQQQYKLK